jgi:predicted Zn-dependent protease
MKKNIYCASFLSLFSLFIYAGIAGAEEGAAITGDDILPVSMEKEKRIGKSIAEQVDKKYAAVDDPLVQERFETIGKRIVAVCERNDFVYRFKVLKAETDGEKYYNAFALPGGYVYIFDTFMEVLETDDKIAAVTAHEIGHVSARHAVKRLQSSLGMNALMLLAVITARDGRTVARANDALTQLMMGYSREDEFEADRLSAKYLKLADFNPEGVIESLQALQKLRKRGSERRYAHYKSHPYLSERIAAANAAIKGYTDFDSYINLPENERAVY